MTAPRDGRDPARAGVADDGRRPPKDDSAVDGRRSPKDDSAVDGRPATHDIADDIAGAATGDRIAVEDGGDDDGAVFVAHRRYLAGIAYRMLGSVAEAEDAVQDAYLRWRGIGAAERARIVNPRAWLATAVTRLALDRLRSARARRESYVGAWLPDPIAGEAGGEGGGAHDGADALVDLANDLSVAMLVALERTSPLERAAFLLHDVFDMEFTEIAAILERSDTACRQLATRARERVHAERPAPRDQPSAATIAAVVEAMRGAMTTGNLLPLVQRLAADAVLVSDGGGKRRAALNPILGRDKILRFFVGIGAKRAPPAPDAIQVTTLNGLPGFVFPAEDDDGVETIAIEITGDGDAARITRIYAVRNPDKLRHLGRTPS